jgi:hypothetical protein
MSIEQNLLKKVEIAIKLLYMQTRMNLKNLEDELLTTEQQRKAYAALDGKRKIDEIAHEAGYAQSRALETHLPLWERRGLILSFGRGVNKRYLNLDNLEV